MMKSEEYSQQLQKLFLLSNHSLKLDLSILKQISASLDYRRLIDITTILFRLFRTGRQVLSMRELIGQSIYPTLSKHAQQPEREGKIDFFVDGLNPSELASIIQSLLIIRKKLKYTIYSSKLSEITDMLKKVLSEVKLQEQKKEDQCILGDVQVMEQQYRKYLSSSIFQNNPNPKILQFLKNPKPFLEAKFTNTSTLLKMIAVEIMPHLQKIVLSQPLNNHTERQGQISRALNFIHNYFIVPYQIEIEISKNTLVETRIYNNKFQKELLSQHRRMVIRAISRIANEAILCPSSINIQILLFRILRRLYYLWDYSTTDNPHDDTNIVRNPLFAVIRNIALFCQGREQELKEAAMFTYKTIQDKNDIELVTLFENCEELRFLKQSKLYSSKAYAFPDQIQKIYEPAQLGSLYPKLYHSIAAREVWAYTILVEKPSSLLSWEFYIGAYDIRFGIFKVQQLKEMSIDEYEKGVQCREVLKMEKVTNTVGSPNKGHLYLKNGVYRLVFDNSFSMMRSKEIYYTFLHLQTQ